jgi:sugar lactone lactonase YvrE
MKTLACSFVKASQSRLAIGLITLATFLTSCPEPTPPPAFAITPNGATVLMSDPAVTFSAAPASSVTWSLSATTAGNIAPTSGLQTTFTPAALVNADTRVTLTATREDGQQAQVAILVRAFGRLTVNVGSPAGMTPNVIVRGTSVTLNFPETRTIEKLLIGTYDLLAPTVVRTNATDTIVGASFDGTVSSPTIQVNAGQTTTASASYAARPGGNHLWVTCSSKELRGYSAAQLASTALNVPPPDRTTQTGGTSDPSGIAIDLAGNAWTSNPSANTITKFTVGHAGAATPAVIISGLNAPHGLAFDPDGNLWVANTGDDTLRRFTPAQIASSGSPTASVTLAGTELDDPWALALSSIGDLWVANRASGTVVRISQLVLGTTTTTVTSNRKLGGTSAGSSGLALSQDGSVWITNATTNTVSGYSATAIGAKDPPAAASVIISGSSLNKPTALAFDLSSALWVTNETGNNLLRYTADQLLASGSPTPAATINGATGARGLAFDPKDVRLPLFPKPAF